MRVVSLAHDSDFDGWRDAARTLALANVPAAEIEWQVGGRSNIDFTGQVRLDIQYIRSESRWLDLKLLLKTIPAVLLGTGAC